ncbi:MAG: hypothetical protein ACLRI7_14150 [Ruthenibacterium lactatiformans]
MAETVVDVYAKRIVENESIPEVSPVPDAGKFRGVDLSSSVTNVAATRSRAQ